MPSKIALLALALPFALNPSARGADGYALLKRSCKQHEQASPERYLALERLLLIRLASRVFEKNRGRLPARLNQLVDAGLLTPVILVDPMSRGRFIHRTHRAGAPEVYSVGRDLDDGGGKPWVASEKSGDLFLAPLKLQGSEGRAGP